MSFWLTKTCVHNWWVTLQWVCVSIVYIVFGTCVVIVNLLLYQDPWFVSQIQPLLVASSFKKQDESLLITLSVQSALHPVQATLVPAFTMIVLWIMHHCCITKYCQYQNINTHSMHCLDALLNTTQLHCQEVKASFCDKKKILLGTCCNKRDVVWTFFNKAEMHCFLCRSLWRVGVFGSLS